MAEECFVCGDGGLIGVGRCTECDHWACGQHLIMSAAIRPPRSPGAGTTDYTDALGHSFWRSGGDQAAKEAWAQGQRRCLTCRNSAESKSKARVTEAGERWVELVEGLVVKARDALVRRRETTYRLNTKSGHALEGWFLLHDADHSSSGDDEGPYNRVAIALTTTGSLRWAHRDYSGYHVTRKGGGVIDSEPLKVQYLGVASPSNAGHRAVWRLEDVLEKIVAGGPVMTPEVQPPPPPARKRPWF